MTAQRLSLSKLNIVRDVNWAKGVFNPISSHVSHFMSTMPMKCFITHQMFTLLVLAYILNVYSFSCLLRHCHFYILSEYNGWSRGIESHVSSTRTTVSHICYIFSLHNSPRTFRTFRYWSHYFFRTFLSFPSLFRTFPNCFVLFSSFSYSMGATGGWWLHPPF